MKPSKSLSLLLLFLLCIAHSRPLCAQSELSVTRIDHLIRLEWKKAGIVSAPAVDDAHFLRRVSLDLVGTLPTPTEVKAFLADKTPYKRATVVERLLNSLRFTTYWVNYWDDVLMGRQVRQALVDRKAFREWLTKAIKQNTPYNRFVYELLTASGVNSIGTPLLASTTGSMQMQEMEAKPETAGSGADVNGAVNWSLKYQQTPADYSGAVSRLFLGVQIQCAQCHDHKTEKWKQEDFRRFTACFMRTRVQPVDRKQDAKGVRRVSLQDTLTPPRLPARMQERLKQNGRLEYLAAAPATLDGVDLTNSPNPREAIARWITAPDNPWFAKAIVNRLWAHFLGRGFVNPIDDFRESNPPIMPELLNLLAEDFKLHGYDLKTLIRLLCSTQVYQLSSQPATTSENSNLLWERYRVKPLKPEVLLDMLVSATNLEPLLEQVAGERLPMLRAGIQKQFTFLFDVDEEAEQKEYEGTIPQALMLLNGNLLNSSVSPLPGTALAEVLASPSTDAQKIESLYLRTLSRLPTVKETQRWIQFVNAPRPLAQTTTTQENSRRRGGGDPFARLNGRLEGVTSPKQQAYEDLFWVLLNSSEFIFNH